MSQLTKHSDKQVLWQVGNTYIVESEPESGVMPMIKTAVLGVAAIVTAPISPVIAVSLAGYAAVKIFSLVLSVGSDSRDFTQNLYNDVHGIEEPNQVPDNWVPMPQATDRPSLIGSSTRLNAVDVPAVEPVDQPFVIPVASPESKLFDWQLLNTAYDDFPHLLLLGKTGAGKSFLAEKLGRFLDGVTLVITPKKKPQDFQGMRVIGLGYDFAAIAANIEGLSKIVKDRETEMNRTGEVNFSPVNVVLDDFPSSIAGCRDLGLDITKDLRFIIRNARTSKVRLILLAQGQEVRTLGFEGEGSLRDNLSYVYLKGFADVAAKESGLDISQYDRPCVIDGKVADISRLVALADQKPTAKVQPVAEAPQPAIASTPEQLERMSENSPADHEAIEDSSEISSSLAEIQNSFPDWKPKGLEIAALIVDWLRKHPTESRTPGTLKQTIATLKNDQKLSTDTLKDKVLPKLVAKGFLVETDGKYAANTVESNFDDDYGF